MVKILQKLGQNQKLGLTGRPPRPIGVLGTCKVNRLILEHYHFTQNSVYTTLETLTLNIFFYCSCIELVVGQFYVTL